MTYLENIDQILKNHVEKFAQRLCIQITTNKKLDVATIIDIWDKIDCHDVCSSDEVVSKESTVAKNQTSIKTFMKSTGVSSLTNQTQISNDVGNDVGNEVEEKTDILLSTEKAEDGKVIETISKSTNLKTSKQVVVDPELLTMAQFTCTQTLASGARLGQICGAKTTGETNYCKKHSKGASKINGTMNGQPNETVVAKTKAVKKPTKEAAEFAKPVMQEFVKTNAPSLKIKKNEFGNYAHIDSNFVYDPVIKKFIGKQHEKNIIPLTVEDIETCKKYSFPYTIPHTILYQDGTAHDKDSEVVETADKLAQQAAKLIVGSKTDDQELAESDDESDDDYQTLANNGK